MSIKLKIKSKHLGEEARIIKFEERKLLKAINYKRQQHRVSGANKEYNAWADSTQLMSTYVSISNHRKWDVRNENRATFLARAYIDGKDYKSVEQSRKPEREYAFVFILPRVVDMVNKYSNKKIDINTIKQWADVK
jgi:hypothetical protein